MCRLDRYGALGAGWLRLRPQRYVDAWTQPCEAVLAADLVIVFSTRAQKEVKFDYRPVHNNPLYKEEMDTVQPFTRVY